MVISPDPARSDDVSRGSPKFATAGSSSCYNPDMKTAKSTPVLDELLAPLVDCLTPESARRLLALKVDRKVQARVDDLAARHSRGELSPKEQAEYGGYVYFDTFVAILKSKARQLLAASGRG
jgi:hypothetical protein